MLWKKLESFHKKQSPGGILYKVEHPKLAKFTRKHPCLSLFFNKVEGLRPAALFKKRLRQRWSPVNFVKFSRTTLLIEHPRWLLSVSSNSQKKAHDGFLKKELCPKWFPKNVRKFLQLFWKSYPDILTPWWSFLPKWEPLTFSAYKIYDSFWRVWLR